MSEADGVDAEKANMLAQQLLLLVTISTIFSTLGARIAYRQAAMQALTRRLEVLLGLLVTWLLWTMLYVLFVRAATRSNKTFFGTMIGRLVDIATYTFTMFFYLYCDDMVQHTTIISGMTPTEAFVSVAVVIVTLAVAQTVFAKFAPFDLVPRARTPPNATKKE